MTLGANNLRLLGGDAGGSFSPLRVESIDTSGLVATADFVNDTGSFGLPGLRLIRDADYKGSFLGYNGTGTFGLVDGVTLAVPAGKRIGFRQGPGTASTDQFAEWEATSSWLKSSLGLGDVGAAGYRLNIKTLAAGVGVRIFGADVNSFSAIDFNDEAGAAKGGVGRGGSGLAAPFGSTNYLYTTGEDWIITTGGTTPFRFNVTTGSVALNMIDGAAAGVGAAGSARLRYNDTTKTLQVSLDGGAYVNVATV